MFSGSIAELSLSALRDGDLAGAAALAALVAEDEFVRLVDLGRMSTPEFEALVVHCATQGKDEEQNAREPNRQMNPRALRVREKDGTPISLPLTWEQTIEAFLQWVERVADGGDFDIRQPYIPVYGFVGIAALAAKGRPNKCGVLLRSHTQAARFAEAIGFRKLIESDQEIIAQEATRTVPLARVQSREQPLRLAKQIANRIAPSAEDAELREATEYSLIELLRNVVQHSHDQFGGVVAAQRTDAKYGPNGQEAIQIAVADCGIGIPRSLADMHPDTRENPTAAIQKAMRAHISGTFPEGKLEFEENAGLGLYFLTAIAKKLGGRFLVSSRGANLVVTSDPHSGHSKGIRSIAGRGFPGTLVCLEIPVHFPERHRTSAELLQEIRDEARAVSKPGKNYCVNFDGSTIPLVGVELCRVLVAVAATDFQTAAKLAQKKLIPAIEAGIGVVIDFENVSIITDSFAHELLAKALRIAFVMNTNVWATNASTAVAKTIEFVQGYALRDLPPRKKRRPPRREMYLRVKRPSQ